MKTEALVLGIIAVTLLSTVGPVFAVGNGWTGYKGNQVIFVGTGLQWCEQKFGWTETPCLSYLGVYAYDKLTMKWNSEWNRGNNENWANPPYAAWLNNEWNGRFPGGSGEVWHYKIVWDNGCATSGTPSITGGYCIWGQFEVLMDQGLDPNIGPGHIFLALATPNGYGA